MSSLVARAATSFGKRFAERIGIKRPYAELLRDRWVEERIREHMRGMLLLEGHAAAVNQTTAAPTGAPTAMATQAVDQTTATPTGAPTAMATRPRRRLATRRWVGTRTNTTTT